MRASSSSEASPRASNGFWLKTAEHLRRRDFVSSAWNHLKFQIHSKILPTRRHDWRGFPLLYKGVILMLWTVWPRWMWREHRGLVMRALELDNHVICQDLKLMDLVFQTVFARGFAKPRQSFRELCNLYRGLERVSGIPGAIAEVGVYRGGSAKILCEAKGAKALHLFDTFSGCPQPNRLMDPLIQQGEMSDTSLEELTRLFSPYRNVFFHPGFFPETASSIADETFSFVHLDVDLYQSTKDCLEFFYTRMSPGGWIVSHDYHSVNNPGVRKAMDEFFQDKPERIISIWDSQCLVVKR